jgi:hypothetical protein
MARRNRAVAELISLWCPIQKELVPEDDERARLIWIIRDAMEALPLPRDDLEARRYMAAIRLAMLATLGIEPLLGISG